jgi:hypothetical protein
LIKLRAKNPFLISQDMIKMFETELLRIVRFGRFVPIGVDDDATTYDTDVHTAVIAQRRQLRLAELDMDETSSVLIETSTPTGKTGQKIPALRARN